MNHGKNKPKGSLTEDMIKRYGRIMVIPLFVLVLIVIIAVADKAPKKEPIELPAETIATGIGSGTGSDAGTDASDASMSQYPEYELAEEEIPEIHALMESYFKAKLDCDPAAMEKVFGNTNTGDTTELEEKMKMESEYIEGYQDITCYTKPGLDESSYIAYVRFNIKFHLTGTVAPGLLWCYVTKDADGSFYIVEEPDQKVSGYIAFVEQSEDVGELITQVNTDLETALAADSKLASIYQILRNGVNTAGEASDSNAGQPEADGSEAQSTAPSDTEAETAAE